VVGNRLEIVDGKLTGALVGGIVDSSVKKTVLEEEMGRLGPATVSLATGDGANDIPMIAAATHGIAYYAKPKARQAADGWIDRGDLTSISTSSASRARIGSSTDGGRGGDFAACRCSIPPGKSRACARWPRSATFAA
jgi:hypothetical protein